MPTRSQKLTVALFFFALALDYRSQDGGGDLMQALLLAVLFGSWLAAMYLLSGRAVRAFPRAKFGLMLIGLLIATAFISAAVNGVPYGNFLRLELRYLLIFMAAALTYRWVRRGKPPEFIFNVVCWAIAASVLAAVVQVVGIQRIPLSEVRYQISPVSSVLLLGFSMYLASKIRLKWLGFFLLCASVIFLSATRTYALAAMAALAWLGVLSVRHRDRALLLKINLTAAAVIIAPFLNVGLPAIWADRISAHSTIADPTWLTRLAEYTTQWRLLTESAFSTFFGRGLGALHYYDPGVVRDIISLGIIRENTGYGAFEFGHSLWVYSAFSQGVLGGWIMPLLFVVPFLASLANSWTRKGEKKDRLIAVQISVGFVGLFAVTFFSHPFGDRFFCVVFGAVATLSLVQRDLFVMPRGGQDQRPTAGSAKDANSAYAGQAAIYT
jgi:hypothetical protein